MKPSRFIQFQQWTLKMFIIHPLDVGPLEIIVFSFKFFWQNELTPIMNWCTLRASSYEWYHLELHFTSVVLRKYEKKEPMVVGWDFHHPKHSFLLFRFLKTFSRYCLLQRPIYVSLFPQVTRCNFRRLKLDKSCFNHYMQRSLNHWVIRCNFLRLRLSESPFNHCR